MIWFTCRLLIALTVGLLVVYAIDVGHGPTWVKVSAALLTAGGLFVALKSVGEGWSEVTEVIEDGSGERNAWTPAEMRSLSPHHAWEYGDSEPPKPSGPRHAAVRRPSMLARWRHYQTSRAKRGAE